MSAGLLVRQSSDDDFVVLVFHGQLCQRSYITSPGSFLMLCLPCGLYHIITMLILALIHYAVLWSLWCVCCGNCRAKLTTLTMQSNEALKKLEKKKEKVSTFLGFEPIIYSLRCGIFTWMICWLGGLVLYFHLSPLSVSVL